MTVQELIDILSQFPKDLQVGLLNDEQCGYEQLEPPKLLHKKELKYEYVTKELGETFIGIEELT